MVAIFARFVVGLIGLTSCFTVASEIASDSRRVVETPGSPASLRGCTNSSSDVERTVAALEDANGAAETQASGAVPSDELEETSAEATLTLMSNVDVVGSTHPDSQEMPTRVETSVVDQQQAPIASFDGKLERNRSKTYRNVTCDDAESVVLDLSCAGSAHRDSRELLNVVGHQQAPIASFNDKLECSITLDAQSCECTRPRMTRKLNDSTWNHLLANTSDYIDTSRDQICKDNTTVSGSKIGNVIKGSYNQSHACRQTWRNRYGRSPSEFFIQLLEARCVYYLYRCTWIQANCMFRSSAWVECPFKIVYL